MVVVAIVALAAGAAALALRDPDAVQLEREAERLALLLEEGRAEARAAGLAAAWLPVAGTPEQAAGFRFVGLPPGLLSQRQWLQPGVDAQVQGALAVTLGPEPLLPPQRVLLRLGDRRLEVASDGLAAFAVVPPAGVQAP
jgi:general secretion pathway protein H